MKMEIRENKPSLHVFLHTHIKSCKFEMYMREAWYIWVRLSAFWQTIQFGEMSWFGYTDFHYTKPQALKSYFEKYFAALGNFWEILLNNSNVWRTLID